MLLLNLDCSFLDARSRTETTRSTCIQYLLRIAPLPPFSSTCQVGDFSSFGRERNHSQLSLLQLRTVVGSQTQERALILLEQEEK